MSSPDTLLSLEALLRVAGPIFFLGMQGSCVKTAMQIFEDQSVGNLSVIPFASLLVNCFIWTFYGLLKDDKTVLYPNGLGILAGGFCFTIYRMYCPRKEFLVNFTVFMFIVGSTAIYNYGDADLLGSIGCIIAVLLMGSPLVTLSTVIQEKSTAAMPFTTSLMTWGNAFSWSLYGLLVAHDVMIYGPNLVGLFLASIQMSLFAIYGVNRAVPLRSQNKPLLF